MPLRLRSAGGGSVQLNSPVALATDVSMEVPAYDGAKVLTNKTPGTVLQVVQAKLAQSTVAISSTTFVSTGLTASITTTAANSKVLVSISGGGFYDQGVAATACWVSVDRNFNGGSYDYATEAYGNNYGLMRLSGDGNSWNIKPYSGQTLDAPNQVAGVVINYRVLARGGGNAFQFQSNDRGLPTLTLMEIAG